MANELQGLRVAFLAADGVEQVELQRPWEALERAGAHVELLSIKGGRLQAFNHLDKGDTFEIDRKVGQVEADEFDALVLPGGVANPDRLRTDRDAVRFVRAFFDQGKPVAAICHAAWTLIEAGVVAGRTLTSWPSLQSDLRNAGARWVDEETHLDGHLLTSRKPDDLPAFSHRMIELFSHALEATTGGSVEGVARRGLAATRGGLIQPGSPTDSVDEASEESFPASDPPSGPSAI
ncbi:type 1 glutamine amidotransferase domain-containing protein [Vulgatibacter sp.]|uniref:type 1 glutamine amidotransferase domain-containing protein n=1 Tax=Vulgatibacter sp. TaxID=1971226 RepID=UPI003568700C